MSPSVMTLPAMNFKFLTEGSLERTGNYRLCEKEGVAVSGAVALRDDKTVKATSTLCLALPETGRGSSALQICVDPIRLDLCHRDVLHRSAKLFEGNAQR
jgi:hypothetical protein